jgi:hypothetical protein
MNMFTSREQLLAGAGAVSEPDVLTCALQLIMTTLSIIDNSRAPGEIGAHLDHALHLLAEHLCTVRGAEGMPGD